MLSCMWAFSSLLYLAAWIQLLFHLVLSHLLPDLAGFALSQLSSHLAGLVLCHLLSDLVGFALAGLALVGFALTAFGLVGFALAAFGLSQLLSQLGRLTILTGWFIILS